MDYFETYLDISFTTLLIELELDVTFELAAAVLLRPPVILSTGNVGVPEVYTYSLAEVMEVLGESAFNDALVKNSGNIKVTEIKSGSNAFTGITKGKVKVMPDETSSSSSVGDASLTTGNTIKANSITSKSNIPTVTASFKSVSGVLSIIANSSMADITVTLNTSIEHLKAIASIGTFEQFSLGIKGMRVYKCDTGVKEFSVNVSIKELSISTEITELKVTVNDY